MQRISYLTEDIPQNCLTNDLQNYKIFKLNK